MITRNELLKQTDLDKRYSGLAVKFWFDLEDLGITFILPFDRQGGRISEEIRYAATIDRPVLIHGETGTGKEVAVQAIHKLSDRNKLPLKSINCANLSNELLESELFGHKKGAFTGANSDRKGVIEEAYGGYIHLDEIGETKSAFQAKLLRLFESGVYYRLGDGSEKKTDVRFVLTTNKPLNMLREDIVHRVKQKITLPSLKKYDSGKLYIAFLIQILGHKYYKAEFNRKLNLRLSLGALAEAIEYDWPGNIRQLKLTLENVLSKYQAGMISDQEEFIDNMGFKSRPGVIWTFGLAEKANVLEYLPKEIYKESVDFKNIAFGDTLTTIWETQNKVLEAKAFAKFQLTGDIDKTQKDKGLYELLLNKNSSTNDNPVAYFQRILASGQPIDVLERQFLLYFIGENAGKYSMHGAAKKLGLSGGGKFRRLLNKHGLTYITKAEMLDALRFIK